MKRTPRKKLVLQLNNIKVKVNEKIQIMIHLNKDLNPKFRFNF